MKKPLISIVLGFALFSAGCVPSLSPLYTDQDLIYDNSLVGVWIDKEAGETWTFSNHGKLEYKLLHTDVDGRNGEFSARLMRIEDEIFLDIVPIKTGFAQSDFYQGFFIATHTFMHVSRKASNVQIEVLDAKWLKEVLAERPDAIQLRSSRHMPC